MKQTLKTLALLTLPVILLSAGCAGMAPGEAVLRNRLDNLERQQQGVSQQLADLRGQLEQLAKQPATTSPEALQKEIRQALKPHQESLAALRTKLRNQQEVLKRLRENTQKLATNMKTVGQPKPAEVARAVKEVMVARDIQRAKPAVDRMVGGYLKQVGEELELTEEQQKQVTAIQTKVTEAAAKEVAAAGNNMRGGRGGWNRMREMTEKYRKQISGELEKILTAEQKTQLQEVRQAEEERRQAQREAMRQRFDRMRRPRQPDGERNPAAPDRGGNENGDGNAGGDDGEI